MPSAITMAAAMRRARRVLAEGGVFSEVDIAVAMGTVQYAAVEEKEESLA
jgi:hypothetical protein